MASRTGSFFIPGLLMGVVAAGLFAAFVPVFACTDCEFQQGLAAASLSVSPSHGPCQRCTGNLRITAYRKRLAPLVNRPAPEQKPKILGTWNAIPERYR